MIFTVTKKTMNTKNCLWNVNCVVIYQTQDQTAGKKKTNHKNYGLRVIHLMSDWFSSPTQETIFHM